MRHFFVVTLDSGLVVREPESTWDDVPATGVASLAVVDEEGRFHLRIDARPGRRFFAANEAVAVKGAQGMLTAKIFGFVEDGTAHEYRVDVLTDQRTYHHYPASELALCGSALRNT